MAKTPIAAALVVSLFTATACTKAEQEAGVDVSFPSAHAATLTPALYPAIDPDATYGDVHEYY